MFFKKNPFYDKFLFYLIIRYFLAENIILVFKIFYESINLLESSFDNQ